jgi:hypothetical protein
MQLVDNDTVSLPYRPGIMTGNPQSLSLVLISVVLAVSVIQGTRDYMAHT